MQPRRLISLLPLFIFYLSLTNRRISCKTYQISPAGAQTGLKSPRKNAPVRQIVTKPQRTVAVADSRLRSADADTDNDADDYDEDRAGGEMRDLRFAAFSSGYGSGHHHDHPHEDHSSRARESVGRGKSTIHQHRVSAGADLYDDLDDDDDDYDSIEEVREEKIDEIVRENDKNLLILFYERESKCPTCRAALDRLEEVDDDLEATGYIEVVKSRDRRAARGLGVASWPGMVYFRRKHPITYDGNFESSESIYRWVRAHEQVVNVDLDDGNFEDTTDSYSPTAGAMDWFVLFYDSKKVECNSFVPVWETVAHQLRGLVNIGQLDMNESDDVADRFNIDDEDDCPTFMLFRKGKMYRYKGSSRDVKSFTNFALQKYKEQRGRRVPEPPTMLEELYEDFKEHLTSKLGEHAKVVLSVIGIAILGGLAALAFWAWKNYKRTIAEKAEENMDKKES